MQSRAFKYTFSVFFAVFAMVAFQNCSGSGLEKLTASSNLERPRITVLSQVSDVAPDFGACEPHYKDLIGPTEAAFDLDATRIGAVSVRQERTWGRALGFTGAFGSGEFQAFLDQARIRPQYDLFIRGVEQAGLFGVDEQIVDLDMVSLNGVISVGTERRWGRHTGFTGRFADGSFQEWIEQKNHYMQYEKLLTGFTPDLIGPNEGINDLTLDTLKVGNVSLRQERTWGRSRGFRGTFGYSGFQRWIDLAGLRPEYRTMLGCP